MSGAPRGIPVVWGNVPQRNKNFTGRDALLRSLTKQLNDEAVTAVLPLALHGLGGVGKTQLAAEYVHRNAHRYQIVWWISADQLSLVRSSLAALAPRLGITDLDTTQVDTAVAAVLDALRKGAPYSRWLLVFDNADQPEDIRSLFPIGQTHGHVLVTSRNHRWANVSDTVEVDVFDRAESIEFLHRRVASITDDDAKRLADELGDLPLALEQAGALQFETGMTVSTYIDLLQSATQNVLAENPPTDYPVPVAAAWNVSMAHVKERMPFALEVLRRCAFFGPEPIPRDMLFRGARALPAPIREQFLDPLQVSRAMRELGRYALARADNNRQTVQVHRLIQKLIRDDLTVEETDRLQHEVHLMLADRDPNTPNKVDSWGRYQELLVHLLPSGITSCTDQAARRLVRNVALQLYAIGDYQTCLGLIDQTLDIWSEQSGDDDADVLILRGQKADLLFGLGRYAEAYELRRPTLARMRELLGVDREQTLAVANGHGADLRARGDFAAALELDQDTLDRHVTVFGLDAVETFRTRNNVSVDNELTARYAEAFVLAEENYRDRLDFYTRDDAPDVIHSLSAISRDLRHLGRYRESMERAALAAERYEGAVTQKVMLPDHPWILNNYRDLAIAERLAGRIEQALDRSREAYERYQRSSFGASHPEALAAGISLGNSLRLAHSLGQGGDLDEAVDLLDKTVERYRNVWKADHPFAHAATINLALAQIALADPAAAQVSLQEALTGLERTVGKEHHYTLVCNTNLATALTLLHDVDAARKIGEDVLPRLYRTLGERHPHTLAAAHNLALDLLATGATEAGEESGRKALTALGETLGADHYDVATARRGGRVSSVIEPPPV